MLPLKKVCVVTDNLSVTLVWGGQADHLKLLGGLWGTGCPLQTQPALEQSDILQLCLRQTDSLSLCLETTKVLQGL